MREEGGLFIYDNWQEAQAARLMAWEGPGGATKFPLMFYSGELFGEAGEASNIVKKLWREDNGVPGSRATIAYLADEFSDVLICARNLAIKANISIWQSTFKYDDWKQGPLYISNLLGFFTGQVCEVVGNPSFDGSKGAKELLSVRLGLVEQIVREGAIQMGIHNLDMVYQTKWNGTSARNGFPHRMELHFETADTF